MRQKHRWLLVAGIVIGVLGVAVVGALIGNVAGTAQTDGTSAYGTDHHETTRDGHAHMNDGHAHMNDGHAHVDDGHTHIAHADGNVTDSNERPHPDAVNGEHPHDQTDHHNPRDTTAEYHLRDQTDHRRGGPCH